MRCIKVMGLRLRSLLRARRMEDELAEEIPARRASRVDPMVALRHD